MSLSTTQTATVSSGRDQRPSGVLGWVLEFPGIEVSPLQPCCTCQSLCQFSLHFELSWLLTEHHPRGKLDSQTPRSTGPWGAKGLSSSTRMAETQLQSYWHQHFRRKVKNAEEMEILTNEVYYFTKLMGNFIQARSLSLQIQIQAIKFSFTYDKLKEITSIKNPISLNRVSS